MRTRAAVLHEYGAPWSVEDINLDPPRAGEVLLQLVAAGLRHSDEHIRQGLMAAPKDVLGTLGLPSMSPTIGGHEGSGVVIEVGDGVSQFTPGGHVVTSFVAVSGKCRWCTSGMEYICDVGAGTLAPGMPTDRTFRHHTTDGQNLGHVSKIGAFAEHTVVSADSIVKVDPHLPLIPAALLACAIPNGYGSAVHRANVREGDTVVVVGTGGIGTAALQGGRAHQRRVVHRRGRARRVQARGTCVLTGLPSRSIGPINVNVQSPIGHRDAGRALPVRRVAARRDGDEAIPARRDQRRLRGSQEW